MRHSWEMGRTAKPSAWASQWRAIGRPLALLMCLGGCGGSNDGVVLVRPSVVAPAILSSEAEQVAAPVRIDAALRFENRSGVEQTLAIGKKGCSCYGIATSEFVLQQGERIKLPAGGSKELYFAANLLEAAGDQAFRVAFQVNGGTGLGGEPLTNELHADCSMKILPDLVLEPQSIVVDLPVTPDQVAGAASASYRLLLQRVTRGQPPAAPPEFSMSPTLLKAEPFESVGGAEEISEGLWRTTWKTTLALRELPEDVRKNGGRFVFGLDFPESSADVPARASSKSGGIPTVLEVVRNDPVRRISGHLILRRSRGIISPAQLHFGAAPAGTGPRARRIVLTAADQKPFVVSAEQTPPGFEVTADSEEPAIQQWLTVTFTADAAGEAAGELALRTTHPDQERVRIMLKARVGREL